MSCTVTVLMSIYKNDVVQEVSQALNSIYDLQIEKPDEIIIVIDGPVKPELIEVVKQFKQKDENIKVIQLEKNVGLGNALNEGLKHCTSAYIARMDADDISVSDRFKLQKEYATSNPEIDVFGGYIEEFGFHEESVRERKVPLQHSEIKEMMKTRNPMNHVTVFIKRESLEKIGGYVEVPFLEDYYLWLRMFAAGNTFANIPRSLVRVRTEEDFNVKRSSTVRIKGWWTLQKFMLSNGWISYFKAMMNMLYISTFTLIPSKFKTFFYTNFLRAKIEN